MLPNYPHTILVTNGIKSLWFLDRSTLELLKACIEGLIQNRDLILSLPPRSGGTTICLLSGLVITVTEDGKVLYLNNRHANNEQACRNLKKIAKTLNLDFVAVHIVGQNRIEQMMTNYLTSPQNLNVLTPYDAITESMLTNSNPYYILLQWAKKHDITLTVPQVAWKDLDPEDYNVLIIDEDRTLDTFFPDDVELMKITISKSKFAIEIPILDKISFIPSKIKKDYPEFIDWLNELANLKQNNNFWEYYNKAVNNNSDSPVIDAIEALMGDIPEPPFDNLTLDEKIRIAEELLSRGWKEEEYEVIKFFIASLFFKAFYLERHRKPPSGKIVYLVPERVLLFKEWLSKFKHIIIRTNDSRKAKAFLDQLEREYEVLEDDEFKYKRNFIVAQSDIFEMAKWLYHHNVPFLVFAGTKEIAEKVLRKLREMGITKIKLADELTSYEEIQEDYHSGHSVVFYANSTISRGVDLPFYDVILVYHFGFASPYEEMLDPQIATERVLNELEQSILRISPIPGVRENAIKLVVFHSSIPNLKYLGERIVGRVEPSKLITIIPLSARVLKRMSGTLNSENLGDSRTCSESRLEYILITPKIESMEIGDFLLYSALRSQNPEITKGVFLLAIRPCDLQLWFKHVEGFRFKKWKQLRSKLREVVKRKQKIEWFIKLLRELNAFEKVGEDCGVNIKTGKHWCYIIRKVVAPLELKEKRKVKSSQEGIAHRLEL